MVLFTNALMLPQVTASTNSTIIPLSAYGNGHHPGRQLGGSDPSEESRSSKEDPVEIYGQLYKIVSKIRCGGSGTVYEATHEGKLVAIKLMSLSVIG